MEDFICDHCLEENIAILADSPRELILYCSVCGSSLIPGPLTRRILDIFVFSDPQCLSQGIRRQQLRQALDPCSCGGSWSVTVPPRCVSCFYPLVDPFNLIVPVLGSRSVDAV